MSILTDSEWDEYTKYLVEDQRVQKIYEDKLKKLLEDDPLGDDKFAQYKRGRMIDMYLNEEQKKENRKYSKEYMLAIPEISGKIETNGPIITELVKQDELTPDQYEMLPPILKNLYTLVKQEGTQRGENYIMDVYIKVGKKGGKRKTRRQRKKSRRFRRSK